MIEVLIPSVATVIASGIAARASIINARHTREIKHQVKNTHTTNLREDLDLIRDLSTSTHERVSTLADIMQAHTERIAHLERTIL